MLIIGAIVEEEIMIFAGGSMIVILVLMIHISSEMTNRPAQLKVRELEKNSVFIIKDSSNLYKIGDTVLVNMTTIKIDPKDSIGMYCVIDTIK